MFSEYKKTDYDQAYSEVYDIITSHKNYSVEVDVLQKFILSGISQPSLRILSIGCGTGAHEVLLAKLGHHVTGIDVSPYMVAQAMAKITPEIDLRFIVRNINQHVIKDGAQEEYDFCVSLFNVINCLSDVQELADFFFAINKAIKPGGSLFFESWNAGLCINFPPEIVRREYDVTGGPGKITRVAIPDLNTLERKLSILYKIKGVFNGSPVDVTSNHRLSLFEVQEIKHSLLKSGFELKKVCAALSESLMEERPAEKCRMIAFLAQKVSS